MRTVMQVTQTVAQVTQTAVLEIQPVAPETAAREIGLDAAETQSQRMPASGVTFSLAEGAVVVPCVMSSNYP